MRYLKKAIKFVTCMMVSVGLLYSLFNINNLHTYFVRYSVGSKTLMVLGTKGLGSGFFVKGKSGKTYILTNAHVCGLKNENDELEIQDEDGNRYIRKVIKQYNNHDLCLVEGVVGKSGLSLSRSKLFIGEKVSLVGHPNGNALTIQDGEYIQDRKIQILYHDFTQEQCGPGNEFTDLEQWAKDLVSKKITINSIEDLIKSWTYVALLQQGVKTLCLKSLLTNQMTTISYPGNSGSPVVDAYGNVVGVLFAGDSASVNDAFVVPLSDIKDFLKDY